MSDPSTPPNSGTKRQYVSIEDDMDDFGESGELSELSPEVIKEVQESPIQLKVVCEEFVNQKDIRSPDKRECCLPINVDVLCLQVLYWFRRAKKRDLAWLFM